MPQLTERNQLIK